VTVEVSMKTDSGKKVCGACARVGKGDFGRKYCPVAAVSISPSRPAGKCVFFKIARSAKSGSAETEKGVSDVR